MQKRALAYVAVAASLWAEIANAQAQPGAAAPPPAIARNSIVSINPLGFLQFGPNLEWERAVTDASGVGFGIRVPSLGLASYFIDEDLESAWTVGGVWHFYPAGTRLRGWFMGPRFEAGKSASTEYTATLYAGVFDFGHRWIKPSGFAISTGGQIGVIGDRFQNRTNSSDTGSELFAFGMFVLSMGIAF